ncbi:uncharacterized protein K489DRAFT_406721 [Dissoconium aciculare CBS 342.82]|uniref:GRF-type domain-containing protein n=1 Tax=Dissoconium aciculare CBS 342.82 TaxID=1314786 RepID=A0A6J3ME76_9PEZI|nr:uncharacterized protein K489DRAFT_406721 [Dissoconium aciculare CBS 342.82]KAF1825914.1 hypothetical protein K489DRAFT_406721 [Dissoconium aciculare CBS 342.82]
MNRGSRYRSRRNFSSSRGRSNGGSSGYHRRNTSTNNAKATARGVFADGVWHCDCTPRLPAEHFKVKKEGTNKGRWFYTCQLDADKRCGFFLWDEEAKPREAAAVLGNSRSEPGAGAQRQTEQLAQPVTPAKESRPSRSTNLPAGKGMFSGTGRRVSPVRLDSPTSSPSPVRDTRGPGKRSARSAGMDDTDDDDFGWALDGPEESELARIADEADTPRKAIKTGVYATPATTTTKKSPRKLPWLDDEPTSPTPARRGAELKTPSFTRNVDEPVTPTTTRTRKSVLDYFAPPVKSGSLSPTSTITDESAETRPEYVQDSYPPVDATA